MQTQEQDNEQVEQELVYNKEIQIATASTRNASKWRNQTIKLSEFVAKLLRTTRTPETFQQYLQLPKTEQDNIKDVGGYVGGVLKGGRRGKHDVANRHIITLDADFADTAFIEKVKSRFSDLCYTLSSTHKHANNNYRLRLVIYPDRPMLPDEYLACARKLADKIGMDYFDDTTYDLNRLMYWPSTSSDGLFYAEHNDASFVSVDKLLLEYGASEEWKDATIWPVSSRETTNLDRLLKKQEDPLTKKGIVGAVCRTFGIHEALQHHTNDAYKQETRDRYTFVGGSTSKGVIVYDERFAFSNHGTDPARGVLCNAFDIIRIHKFGHLDEKTGDVAATKLPSYAAMVDWAKEIDNVKRELIKVEQLEQSEIEELFDGVVADISAETEENEWFKQLQLAENGDIKPTFVNAVLIVANDSNINKQARYNEFAVQMENSKGELWSAPDSYRVRMYVGRKYNVDFPESKIEQAIEDLAHKNKFHPVRDYLLGLSWDFTERVETLFVDYLHAEDTKYCREAAKCFLVAAVRRILQPGYKFDNVPALGGAQGIGKTTFIQMLAVKKEWAGELTSFDPKIASEETTGKWFIEMGEMQVSTRSSIEQEKSFISATSLKVRQAYARYPIEIKRQFVLMATTNEEEYLKDSTGNRRWWPIDSPLEYGKTIDFEGLTNNIDRIWAEAVFLAQMGESTLMSKEALQEATSKQESKMEADEWEGIINAWLETEGAKNRYDQTTDDYFESAEKETREIVCIVEVWEDCLKMRTPPRPYDRRRISKILSNNPAFKKDKNMRFGKRFGVQKSWTRDTPF